MFQSVLDGEVTLWDAPDVLFESYTNWAAISCLLRVPSSSGVIESLDFVLCGDPSVSLRLHVLSLVFRARMYKFCKLGFLTDGFGLYYSGGLWGSGGSETIIYILV